MIREAGRVACRLLNRIVTVSLPLHQPTGLSIIIRLPPAKCELDTDGFQSGFLLLDKQDPGQAHIPSDMGLGKTGHVALYTLTLPSLKYILHSISSVYCTYAKVSRGEKPVLQLINLLRLHLVPRLHIILAVLTSVVAGHLMKCMIHESACNETTTKQLLPSM